MLLCPCQRSSQALADVALLSVVSLLRHWYSTQALAEEQFWVLLRELEELEFVFLLALSSSFLSICLRGAEKPYLLQDLAVDLFGRTIPSA
jgi:hypothetical protein